MQALPALDTRRISISTDPVSPGCSRPGSNHSSPKRRGSRSLIPYNLPTLSPTSKDQCLDDLIPDFNPKENNGNAVFDIYNLRQWFIGMDSKEDGHVSKNDFVAFFHKRPELKNVLLSQVHLKNTDNSKCTIKSQQEIHALEMRRLLKLFTKDLDTDKSGTLEWHEFINFFRNTGCLVEYSTPNNPRERLSDVMGKIAEQKAAGKEVDEELINNLDELACKHLSTPMRQRSKLLIEIDTPRSYRRRASAPEVPSSRTQSEPGLPSPDSILALRRNSIC
jgi:hypothetical protein